MMRSNKLNDLDAKTWLKFQKSWFVHNPPPRKQGVLAHPAKFPETLAQEFIEFFTKRGEVVLDPMAGTGSTLVAALRAGRHSYGIELSPRYALMAQQALQAERSSWGADVAELHSEVICADAARANELQLPKTHYVLTSPPYWDMLHSDGSKTQKARRSSPDLDVVYSSDAEDLGNIHDYGAFLERLVGIYAGLKPILHERAYLTIIVKNVKKGGRVFPLAWDLGHELSRVYSLKDEKLWCQDNQRLSPFGLGSAWVSNTFHHYCLQFRNDR